MIYSWPLSCDEGFLCSLKNKLRRPNTNTNRQIPTDDGPGASHLFRNTAHRPYPQPLKNDMRCALLFTCFLFLAFVWQVPAIPAYEFDLALSPRGSGSDRSRSPSPTKPQGGSPAHHADSAAKPASPGHPSHATQAHGNHPGLQFAAERPREKASTHWRLSKQRNQRFDPYGHGVKAPWYSTPKRASPSLNRQTNRMKKLKLTDDKSGPAHHPEGHHEHPPKGSPKGSPPGSPGAGSHAVSKRSKQEAWN